MDDQVNVDNFNNGIPFIVEKERLLSTIDSFARLFIHIAALEDKYEYKCSQCQNVFLCHGEYLYHKEEQANADFPSICTIKSMKKRVAYGTQWGYYIADKVTEKLVRSVLSK